MMIFRLLLMISLVAAASQVDATPSSLGTMDNFRLGNQGVFCSARSRLTDRRFETMFDRGYDIYCRDAALPVGKLYVLRARDGDFATHFAASREQKLDCAPATSADLTGIGAVQRADCHEAATGLNYSISWVARDKNVYAVEGLTAYDSALTIGLQSIVADHVVTGRVVVVTTNAGDPAALARVQATKLDPSQALLAGYARGGESNFADASEYFDALVVRSNLKEPGADRPSEYLLAEALLQSNLGNFAEAKRLFGEAEHAGNASDAVFARLKRNYAAMDRMNQRDLAGARAVLDSAVPAIPDVATDTSTAAQDRQRQAANAKSRSAILLTQADNKVDHLTPAERATLLDAQKQYLKGVTIRASGNDKVATALFADALRIFDSVREGRVQNMAWLPAAVDNELARMATERGDKRQAEAYLKAAQTLLEELYPESATALAARARVANFEASNGNSAAIANYRQIVQDAMTIPGGNIAIQPLLAPYLDALVARQPTDPTALADFFTASQIMVRPGVAQTQAVFARQLTAGNSEASGLFRESVNMTREIITLDSEVARLSMSPVRSDDNAKTLAADVVLRNQLAAAQTALLTKLAAYPKFQALVNSSLSLTDLQHALRGGEAYYKLIFLGEQPYAILVTANAAKILKIDSTRSALETMTNRLRDSIVVEINHQLITDPFDIATAYSLYRLLFAPVSADIADSTHLIFEPDGPLLKLPASVLVTEKASVDAYLKRTSNPSEDPFDFTDVAWLGRNRMVSTSISPQSFLDVRALPASTAPRRYLGFGQNTPTRQLSYAPHSSEGRNPCDWPLSLWDNPVSSTELTLASAALGGSGNMVVTGTDFSDTAVRGRTDLPDFRVVQFATHGLVTAPHPGCPARPALVTSFGPRDSDGLLSFKEIFDLHFDADTIILSACDTAGAATSAATREAGITTGGNFALDGLVRAFIGAGARTVIASHWPVPDDYNATQKLMTGLFQGGTQLAVGEALRRSQVKLMDDPLTSHPYYWAAFAIIGDGSKPMTTDRAAAPVSSATSAGTQ